MSDLLGLTRQIGETSEMIAKFEKSLSASPGDRSLQINLRSLEKRKKRLENQFAQAADLMGYDYCRYRFVPETGGVKVSGLASVIGHFQTLVSLVCEALTSGPRMTSKLGAEALAKTAFDFGYSFAGSVGFALTIPNSRLMGVESKLDETFALIAVISKASKPEDIKEHAKKIGRAPMRLIYQWAKDHVHNHFSAEFEWGRGDREHARFLIQESQFDSLARAIDETSEEDRTEIDLKGVLSGANVDSHSFYFKADTGEAISGSTRIVDESHTVVLPKRYAAKLVRTRKIYFATEEQKDHYELINLQSI